MLLSLRFHSGISFSEFVFGLWFFVDLLSCVFESVCILRLSRIVLLLCIGVNFLLSCQPIAMRINVGVKSSTSAQDIMNTIFTNRLCFSLESL